VQTISGVATSITAFVGWAEQGPSHDATLVESFSDFENQFGGLDSRSYLGYALYQFFINGGSQAYVVRLVSNAPGGSGRVLVPNSAEFDMALNLEGSGNGGVHLLDSVPIFNLLCVPGETSERVIAHLQKYCTTRRAFYIVDCNPMATFRSLEGGPATRITGTDAINSALYFPWVQAPDPLQAGQTKQYPPCGFVAGIYAATDNARGVWKAPAGVAATLTGASGLVQSVSDEQNGALETNAINCLRSFPEYGNVVWGARTLQGSNQSGSEWKYVPVRRLALFLESSLYAGTQWVVFEPNGEPLWGQISLAVGDFMQGLFLQGAFQGDSASEAYFVQCDAEVNPRSSVDDSVVNIIVGFAPLYPAEFVVIRIQQLCGAP
jgi:phage tail sheath protein FI